MLEKKETIQKTFRLDSKINDNLEVLSNILERTQNDLVNVAIQNLLEENETWLAHNIFIDYAFNYFENGCDTNFTIDTIMVDLKIDEDTMDTILKIVQRDKKGKIVDGLEKKYKYDGSGLSEEADIKRILREEYNYIDPNCKQVKEYLKNVNNYK